MYLIDTNVISELRKKSRANPGVIEFFDRVRSQNESIYLSAITIGELTRGLAMIRHRGDVEQAGLLQDWLAQILNHYRGNILEFDVDAAQVWGHLRVPNPENEIDKQIAAIALIHDLVVVTRNVEDFAKTGVRYLNPFVEGTSVR